MNTLIDLPIHTDRALQASKPDITRKDRTKESWKLIHFTFPVAISISAKELEKLSEDKNIHTEEERMCNQKHQ